MMVVNMGAEGMCVCVCVWGGGGQRRSVLEFWWGLQPLHITR